MTHEFKIGDLVMTDPDAKVNWAHHKPGRIGVITQILQKEHGIMYVLSNTRNDGCIDGEYILPPEKWDLRAYKI